MPPRANKRQPAKQPTSKAAVASIPPPFSNVPSTLEDFVDELDREKVYITHIDTQSITLKKQAFYTLLVLNVVAATLLAWRAYSIIPTYWSYILTILGHRTKHWVDPAKTRGDEYVWIIGKRFLTIAFDYTLVSMVAPWPVSFFFELPANPCLWRWRVGFKEREIIVRESRQWAAQDLVGSEKKGADHPIWFSKVLPAVRQDLIQSKTGYATQGKDWTLDFEDTLWAENLVKQEKNSIEDFRTQVIVHMEPHGWLTWTAEWEELSTADEEASRKKIAEFKDRLTGMGKESLFFRWIELIQYQTSRPGGFTAARKQETVDQARTVFQAQGVDFDEFAQSIGGLDDLPGMDEQA